MATPRSRRIAILSSLSLAVLLLVLGFWTLHSRAAAERAHRKEWVRRAGSYRVPVYPERPARIWLPVPRSFVPARRETIVQVETEIDVGNLMRLGLADYPDGLVIMEIGISAAHRRLLAERYPKALIVAYPNMPP